MKRVAASISLLAVLGFSGCSKPAAEDCRKAVLNMQRIRQVDKDQQAKADPELWVRKCRSTGSSDSVKCIIDAKTVADLDRCEGR